MLLKLATKPHMDPVPSPPAASSFRKLPECVFVLCVYMCAPVYIFNGQAHSDKLKDYKIFLDLKLYLPSLRNIAY